MTKNFKAEAAASLEELADAVRGRRRAVHGPLIVPGETPAQAVMRTELLRSKPTAKADSTLSREGHLHQRAEELATGICDEADLMLTMPEWRAVRALVLAGISAGRSLERDL